jgi:hypothetical protein
MATSGIVKTNVKYGSYFWVKWEIRGSQDIANNRTTIAWSCGLHPEEQYYTNAVKMNAVTINGTEVYSGGTYSDITDYKDRTFDSGTLTIPHNSDGSKSFTISAVSGWIYDNGNYYGEAKSFTLPTIPRASSVSCSTANIGSNTTITINRASTSFTHTLTYSFGSLSGTIATKTSSTNISWTIPTTFYGQIPNSKSGTGTITCQTYNGSTLIGSKSTSFTATVNESASKPTLSPTVSDSNSTTTALTGDSSKFIKYYSNASVATGAKARNSATLKSQKITCGAKSITSASGTINAVESGSFTFSATDSRGYTTTQTINKTLIDYIKLTCSMEAGAPTTAGVATLKISGNYWNGSFGKVANTLTVQYRYKAQGGSYGNWIGVTATKSGNTYNATATISGLDYKTTYVFQARAVDKLATISTDEQARRTTPIFDWSKDDFNVNGTLKVNNTNIFDLIYPVGSIYISVNSTNPGTLFGGTWEQIQGRFLLGMSSSYPMGSTGGSKDAVVVAHTHNPANEAGYSGFITNSKKAFSIGDMGSQSGSGRYYPFATSAFDISRNTATGSTGVSGTDKNMPPYLAVAIWKRTA